MIEPAYHFCPRCGGALEVIRHENEEMQACGVCHEILYKNQNTCVVGVIVRDEQMLIARRKIDPHKGWLDLPGGFVNPNENPKNAIMRELREELGVEAQVLRLLGVFGPNPYPYRGVMQYNSDVIYLMDIGTQIPIPSDDVASIEWWPLSQLPNPRDLAFVAQREFLEAVVQGEIDLRV